MIFGVDRAVAAVGHRVVRLDAVFLVDDVSGSRMRASLWSGGVAELADAVVVVVDEAVATLLLPDLRRLEVALGLLVLLQVGLLPEVDAARQAVEGPDTFVNALVHVPVACGSKNLKKKITKLKI